MSNKESIIGKNMKFFRNKQRISQDILSKKAGLAFHTIAKIEAGSTPNPSVNTASKIAAALDISLDDLLKESKTKWRPLKN